MIVGEVGKVLAYHEKMVLKGRLKSIALPARGGGQTKQQCISQNAHNFLFRVRGDKKCVDKLMRLLTNFSDASKTEINWEKSCAYLFDKYMHKP